MLKQRRNFRTGTERHANRFTTSASRSNIRYSLSDTHATPDGYPVKQIGEHAWLIEKAGIVIHKCPRNPFTGNRIFALSCGDNQFGQDFTLYEALRTVDRLLRGQSFINRLIYNGCFMTKDHAQGVFIRFIDFRGELLLRASAIDGVTPAGKNGADEATYVYLNGTRLLVELPYQTVREIISEAEKARQVNGDEPYIEIICMDSEAEIQKAD
ncbi:DUF4761 family protein [Salmonella enterica]|nr:DUF4761 family protein [Salmonella enterica]EFT9133073.1 DUF4761 family protein [Salmonella enterica]